MQFNTDIIIKNIERSPKFRTEYINNTINEYPELCDEICNIYQLELIMQVYFLKINVNTFNSQKRRNLKREELILIKKILIYVELEQNFIKMEQFAEQLSTIFNQNVADPFAYSNDLLMVELMCKKHLKNIQKNHNTMI